MKIISKYIDYYDSVQGVMYDSDIKYIRVRTLHSLKLRFGYIGLSMFNDLNIIGFCGKLYPVIKISNIHSQQSINIESWISKNGKKLLKGPNDVFPDTHMSYDLPEIIPLVCSSRRFRYSKRNINESISNISNIVSKLESMNLFDEFNTPIFVVKTTQGSNDLVLESGIPLKDYSFQQIMDPYSTYQELVMWIGNKACNEYPPQITDNIVLRDSKGFDKWSFKTMPGQKRKRGNKK